MKFLGLAIKYEKKKTNHPLFFSSRSWGWLTEFSQFMASYIIETLRHKVLAIKNKLIHNFFLGI